MIRKLLGSNSDKKRCNDKTINSKEIYPISRKSGERRMKKNTSRMKRIRNGLRLILKRSLLECWAVKLNRPIFQRLQGRGRDAQKCRPRGHEFSKTVPSNPG